jgi:hypothetical protein
MDRKAMKGKGFTVETNSRASLARISRETHGRASLLVALLFLFATCEKDLPRTSGGKVAIIFSISGSESEAPRSFALKGSERSEVEIENEENYFLSATLAPDEEGLRAVTTSALIENQKVHLEAYIHSTGDPAGAADYHANAAGQLVLDDPDSPLEVDPAEGPFDFAAYSYYKSTAAISTTGIDPRTDDLIWGHIENQPITETEVGRTVSFNLKHKFTQVRVKISVSKISGATITDIGTVTIENQNTVDLTVQDGALSNYTNVGALDVSSSLYTGDNITYFSDYYVFHPSPTKVNISSIEVMESGVAKTYTNLYTTFTQGLAAEGSYTLAVDFTKYPSGMFAGSNIYWDEERETLTFDKVARVHDGETYSSQYYQGIYFKWMSLIGIAPDYSLYIPDTNTRTWNGTKTLAESDWTRYYDIPYGSNDIANYMGDICTFIDNAWRLPTIGEFAGEAGTGSIPSFSVPLNTSTGGFATPADGTGICTVGGTYYAAFGSIFLPGVGCFDQLYVNSFTQQFGGSHYMIGCYHTTSPTSYLSIYTPGANASIVTSGYAMNGLSVRCVKS